MKKGIPFASADVHPFAGKADRNPVKLPNKNFGAKKDHLRMTVLSGKLCGTI